MNEVSKKISWEITKKAVLPVLILAAVIILYVQYNTLVAPLLPVQLQESLKKYISTVFVISITFTVHRVIGSIFTWYKEHIASRTITRLDDELIPLFSRTSKIAIWIISLLIILPFFGINISALIATLGVSSLAIALAAQDTIANIISGFMIMIDRPFGPGDKIKLPSGEMVKVLDIGVRRSRFLAEDKAIIIMPNLELSKSKIVNYTYGEKRINNNNSIKF